ncbi:hypothetical protein IEQ34_009171 [Dendrobium chrysotoxum]|uniref:Uncharacterized protein n=1 Tax=Dendrobium chrysotoxum TaxID=161865 RepID=A0AAV7GXV6_DENCH|nr:hypothetical protein IEQ34_009171 [Dendrobium chrysotoxum]
MPRGLVYYPHTEDPLCTQKGNQIPMGCSFQSELRSMCQPHQSINQVRIILKIHKIQIAHVVRYYVIVHTWRKWHAPLEHVRRAMRHDARPFAPLTIYKDTLFFKSYAIFTSPRVIFAPIFARRLTQDKIIRFVQRDKSVMRYEAEYTILSKYAPQLISSIDEKCYQFLSGLNDAIRKILASLEIDDYRILIEEARMVELDFQII